MAVHGDGTYDIEYDDGDHETNVPSVFINRLSRGNDVFAVGQPVTANYQGKGSFYSGKISAVNNDGPYDITYDDGDFENNVPAALLRKNDSHSFVVGEKVTANYGGQGTFYSGVISAVNEDGTFDIAYDDGDREQSVREELIKKSDHGGSASNFQVGDKVSAHFADQDSSGTITKVNTNGTYNIEYDDGHREQNVKQELIRLST